MRLYESIDVLLEQFILGWYGGQAVECMSMGIPVVVWIRQEDLQFVPKEMVADMPFMFIEVDKLDKEIERIVNDPSVLHTMRIRGLQYVNKWHNPKKIAEEING